MCTKDFSWNPSTSTWYNRKYLRSIVISVIVCDEIKNATDSCYKMLKMLQMQQILYQQMCQKLYQQMLWVLCQQILMIKM